MRKLFDTNDFKTHDVSSKGKPATCASCGMYKWVLTPRMQAHGKAKRRILLIGLGPGEDEDQKGAQWQGKAGRRLKKVLKKFGIELFEDCAAINAVNCRPVDSKGNNRTPTDFEIECCRKHVWQVIEQVQPHLILLFGGEAVKSFLGHRWRKDLGGIFKWRGWTIPDRDVKAWVCPLFHPSYVERVEDKIHPEATVIWERDLDRALSKLDEPFPNFTDERKRVEIVPDDQVEYLLQGINMDPATNLSFIDLETTGKKPQAKGHRIECISLSTSPDYTYVFQTPKYRNGRVLLTRYMANPYIGKMAHNLPFEKIWLETLFRARLNSPAWCSMHCAHFLDNRPGICGLKFQAYVNFGLVDYDSHISPYLESTEKNNANAFNQIDKFIERHGEEELMIYCGLDNILGHRLCLLQMDQIHGHRQIMGNTEPPF